MRCVKTIILLGIVLLAAAVAPLGFAKRPLKDFSPPEGFIPPPLNPAGVELQTKELAPGVYALLSGRPGVDNSGFVVGERGVLVIDAHINGTMARQIQAAVKRVTDKPILYLVNTNYHGDHTFGNYAFPTETLIVAHWRTALRMRDFEHEKQFLLQTVNNDPGVFADVQLRLPDLTFDHHLRIDLGGKVVELYHFGSGNTPGDTIVYVPEAQIAWTGNLVLGEETIPPLFEGGAEAYLGTITLLAQSLDIEKIVPGHGVMTSGEILGRYLTYLNRLIVSVRSAIRDGLTLEETLVLIQLWGEFAPQPGSPLDSIGPLIMGFHRLNVQNTYLELSRVPTASTQSVN